MSKRRQTQKKTHCMISFIKTPKQMMPSVLLEDKIVVTLEGMVTASGEKGTSEVLVRFCFMIKVLVAKMYSL